MRNILYELAAIILLFWGIGFYVFNVGAVIHILLLVAVLSTAYNFFQKKEIAE